MCVYLLRLTDRQAAAVIKCLSRDWLGGDEHARAALAIFKNACPEVCEFCYTDRRVGAHTMRRCFDAEDRVIKRG